MGPGPLGEWGAACCIGDDSRSNIDINISNTKACRVITETPTDRIAYMHQPWLDFT